MMIRTLQKKLSHTSAFFKGLTVKHDAKTIQKIGTIPDADFERARERYSMLSPNGKIEVVLSSAEDMRYFVLYRGEMVIEPSSLGLVSKGIHLGQNVLIGKPHQSQTDDVYKVCGKHARARNLNNSYLFPVKHLDTSLEYYIEFMLWNDGIGFRYIFQEGTKLYVSEEKTQFNMPSDSICWYQTDPTKLQARTVKQETRYLVPDITVACLVTFQLRDDKGYVILTESDIRNYPGCAFKTKGRGSLQVNFWDTKRFFVENCVSPWRLAIICPDLDALANNNVVTNSAQPPSRRYADTSYIKPGKSAWTYFAERPDNCNFDTIMQYNREIEKTQLTDYNLIDASWKKWGITEIGAFIKVKRVVDDANSRGGFGIWIWKAMTDGLYFGLYRRWFFDQCVKVGVKGVKIDLIESETPFQINLYRKILRETADRKLMVIFHNPQKPTGLERTYPNLLSMESIRGVQGGLDPDDSTILPFTRLAVSGADFTPCCLSVKDLMPLGTWTHMMAASVIM